MQRASGSAIEASWMNADAIREIVAASRARRSASRVLPVPPGPVRVSSRVPVEQLPRSSQFRLAADETGHLVGQQVEAGCERRAAAESRSGRPAMASWNRRSGWSRSLSRCSPRSTQRDARRAGRPSTRSRVVAESDTWPPWAAARDARRAVDVEADVLVRQPAGRRRCECPSARATAHAVRPRRGGKLTLGRDSGGDGVDGASRRRRRTSRPRS